MAQGNRRLRVIGGLLKGRRLDTLAGESIRPTGDRVREALFDILGERIRDAAFLDVYAGTGAIGIEALSRGARDVTFIENEPAAAELIQKNLFSCGLDARQARVIARDPAQAAHLLMGQERRFDIVYLDPPYAGGELERGLRLVADSGLLDAGAIVIGEHEAKSPSPVCRQLSAYRTATYGRVALTFFAPVEAVAPR